VLCAAAGVILINLVADVLYFVVNPRMRSTL
jgi:peptide/nickel transport system permease protein